MGITLLFIIIAVLLFYLTKYADEYKWTHVALGIAGIATAVAAAIMLIALVVNISISPHELSALQLQAEQYQYIVDHPSTTPALDQNQLYREIVYFNAKIASHRSYSDSFWFRGWYSRLWYQVPLVEFPNT